MEYSIIYSKRKTLAISVKDGAVIVRAPRGLKKGRIEFYVEKHRSWIEKSLERVKRESELVSAMSEREIAELKKSAKIYFKDKIELYSNIMGLKYSRMRITSAKKRFGSCSSAGNISFSYRLMLYPEAAREYVVVHELAHLVHMNHSADFYALIAKYMPDYKERKKLLKQ